MSLQTFKGNFEHPEDNATHQARQDVVFDISLKEGLKWGVATTLIVGGATAIAMVKSKRFRESTTVAVRTSFPTMAFLGVFTAKFETTQIDVLRNPHRYGLVQKTGDGRVVPLYKPLPLHKQFMNFVHDKPFYLVGMLGVPLVGGMYYSQHDKVHLSFAKKVMHTRVMGQGGVLCIVILTMGLMKYMERRGPYEPELLVLPSSSSSEGDK